MRDKEETTQTLIAASVTCMMLETSGKQYSEIWQDVRRIIVRACTQYLVDETLDDNILRLAETIKEHGVLA